MISERERKEISYGMKEKYNLREELLKADQKYLVESPGDHSIEGKTILTWPGYINSMRSVMFASHLGQFKNQRKPSFPQFFTAAENLVGRNSSGYKRMNESVIFRKIVKYEDLVDKPTVAVVFYYDKKKKRYDILQRKDCKDLGEMFGYEYSNEVIDSFEEGDEIEDGTIPYASTSYDPDMNYRYGKDIITMLTLDPFTSEDSAVASDELEDEVQYIETEKRSFTLNPNDYPLNLYGDEIDYKIFPNIGESSKGVLIAARRKFNNQVLFDFKEDMLRKLLDSDPRRYAKGEVVDIEIFCNDENLQDNSFYHQIYEYWVHQNKFYQEIKETCEEIFRSGEKYSANVDYAYDRALKSLDLVKEKWRKKDTAYAGVEVRFTVKRVKGIGPGQKLAGRCGNKFVISEIRPKEQMPYYYDENGNKVHVQLMISLLGIVNRTTAMPLFEMATNFMSKRISQKLRSLRTMREKEKLLFDYIYMFNEDFHRFIKEDTYDKLSKEEKKEFMSYCENVKIHLHNPSMWEKKPIFYRLYDIYEKYKDLFAPDDMYIMKWGRERKCLSPSFISNMYIITLKQTAIKGFSVRGIGAINQKGVPARSYKSKNGSDLYSSTAIRFGESETLRKLGVLVC